MLLIEQAIAIGMDRVLLNYSSRINWTIENGSRNCSSYDSVEFKIIAALRAGVGTLSAVCCLVVIFLIVTYKKYTFFAQRQIAYLAATAFLQSLLCSLGRVNFYTSRPIIDPYCLFAGFFHEYSDWTEVVSIVCITFNVFSIGVLGRNTARLEIIYVVLIFILPLTWSWVPFLQAAYGTAGPWCGVRTVTQDCELFKFGRILQLAIGVLPLYFILVIAFVLTCITACKVHRDLNRWSGQFHPEVQARMQDMGKEIRLLLWYPAIYLALETPSFVNQLYHTHNPFAVLWPLWLLEAILSPMRGAFLASVYAFDSETRARMRCQQLRYMLRSCFIGGHNVMEYSIMCDREGDTLPRSSDNSPILPKEAALSSLPEHLSKTTS